MEQIELSAPPQQDIYVAWNRAPLVAADLGFLASATVLDVRFEDCADEEVADEGEIDLF